MPVSVTANAITCRRSCVGGRTRAGGRSQRDPPWSVNLNALESRLRSTCCSRCSSVTIGGGSAGSSSTRKSRPFCSASGRNARSTSSQTSTSATAPRSTSILPASTLDRSRMSLISDSRSVPAAWIVCGELDLLVGEVAVGVVGQQPRQDQQRVQRRAQLVAHVGQELRLVLRATARAARPSPRGRARASSISRFLISMSRFCCGSSARLLLQLGVGAGAAPRDCFCSSWARRCDCASSSSVRMLALDRVEHDADRLGRAAPGRPG